MPRNRTSVNDRARQMLAQEAARIIVEQGIEDYRLAKIKAAERLGLRDRGSLHGTAGASSAVNLHVFTDTPELVAIRLHEARLPYRPYERRLKSRRDRAETYAGYRFVHDDMSIEATVFPENGMRQAPISPVDGRPMKRADRAVVERLLEEPADVV